MSSKNKYVDFVSDEDFLEVVTPIVEAYSFEEKTIDEDIILNLLKYGKNTNDEIKTIFDIVIKDSSLKDWADAEIKRQEDKSVSTALGTFHQNLLGKVDGWINLHKGDTTKVDLKNEDNTIFIELKNKYNTLNAGGKSDVRINLEKLTKDYPNAMTYWAYIVSRNYKTGEEVWHMKDTPNNERIHKIYGKKVYELITGDPDALEKLYKAIPIAIVDILGEDYRITDEKTLNIINEYRNFVFHEH